ncbi:MAG: heavy metal translocating P-type ATPase [Deltaproteobacteria bacterium]|nr:heavy metal translocating P-type ATPase [Deltaproteobacteria bacterium]
MAEAIKVTHTDRYCLHCNLPIPTGLLENSDKEPAKFCCKGCESVYQILNDSGLEAFYKVKGDAFDDKPQAALVTGARYEYFDDPKFISSNVTPQPQGLCSVQFLLDGVHCSACVWLLEKLPILNQGILNSQVQFSKSSIEILYDPLKISLSKIAQLIDSLGYRPRIYRLDINQDSYSKSLLLRIGVAGFCAGNTMLLAVSLYQGLFTGIEERYRLLLHIVSLVLTLPAIFYSAAPFYQSAIAGLKLKMLHIDLPISLGISIGFLASAYNTFVGAEHVYFDSVCMLIFLLLIGRWFQHKGVKQAADSAKLLPSLLPHSAIKVNNDIREEVYIESLQETDLIEVGPNQVMPVDGTVTNGDSQIDLSILSGESKAQPVEVGSKVFAGSLNLGSKLQVQVERVGAKTRMGSILELVDKATNQKSQLMQLTDRISGYFVFFVITFALFTFGFWYQAGFEVAFNHTLAFLVITCPCALGLAAPVTLSVAISKAAKLGIFIRSAEALEHLTKVVTVYFDKTGTLTKGLTAVVETYPQLNSISVEDLQLLKQLEQNREHPIAYALLNKLSEVISSERALDLDSIKELAGRGISAYHKGDRFLVGSYQFLKDNGIKLNEPQSSFVKQSLQNCCSPVFFAKQDQVLTVFAVGDALKEGLQQVLSSACFKQKVLGVLSGDNKEIVRKISSQLGLEKYHAELTPEDKVRFIEQAKSDGAVAFFGDGVNDVAALAAADIGIGVSGGAEASLKVADIYLADPDPKLFSELFEGAGRTLRTVQRNLYFSLIYNLIGGSLAIAGYINPLAAAIIMPLSSLTVVLSSTMSHTFKK